MPGSSEFNVQSLFRTPANGPPPGFSHLTRPGPAFTAPHGPPFVAPPRPPVIAPSNTPDAQSEMTDHQKFNILISQQMEQQRRTRPEVSGVDPHEQQKGTRPPEFKKHKTTVKVSTICDLYCLALPCLARSG